MIYFLRRNICYYDWIRTLKVFPWEKLNKTKQITVF